MKRSKSDYQLSWVLCPKCSSVLFDKNDLERIKEALAALEFAVARLEGLPEHWVIDPEDL